jgi:large subunit ribosomal protein L31e
MIREFAMRHMKSSEVKIDQGLSEEIWSRGIEKPPRRITVKMDKGEDGIVTVSHLPIDNKTTIKESKPASQAEVKESKPASQAEVKDTVTDSETEGVSKDSSSLEQGKSG